MHAHKRCLETAACLFLHAHVTVNRKKAQKFTNIRIMSVFKLKEDTIEDDQG